jgi:hypothetical protein
VSAFLYGFGSNFRFPGWFAEMYYLSTYFPNIGIYAGAFDSLLPFLVLSGVGFLFLGIGYVGGLFGLGVAGALVGLGFLCIALLGLLLAVFTILAILKGMGLFKKRAPSTVGDRQ